MRDVRAEEPCGQIKVRAGDACEFLDVVVDLSACGGGKGPAEVECDSDGTARVSYATPEGTYRGSLKKGTSGWSVAEALAKSGSSKKKKKAEAIDPAPKTDTTPKDAAPKKEKKKKSKREASKEGAVSAETRPVSNTASASAQPSPAASASPAPAPELLPVFPSPVPAPSPSPIAAPTFTVSSKSPLTISGSARFRAEARDNLDFNDAATDSSRFGLMRFRLDFLFKPRNDVTVFVQPQAARVWGKNEVLNSGTTTSGGATVPTTTSGGTGTSGGTQDSRMDLHQGYVGYRPGDSTELTVGRQVLSYGDELLIGALEWHNVGRTFDAMRASQSLGGGKVDFFWSKITERNDSTAGGGDKDFYGVYGSWNLGTGFKAADLYALRLEEASTSPKQKTSAVGLRLKSPLGAADYRIEATGENVRGNGEYQVDAELGYTLVPAKKTRISAEYFRSSRSFEQFFPTVHKWLGYADYFSRRNIQGYRIGAGTDLSSNVSITADYHVFARTDASAPAYTLGGASYGNSSAGRALAREIDVVGRWKLNDSLTLSGGGSWVAPSAYMKAVRGRDSGYFSYIEALLQF